MIQWLLRRLLYEPIYHLKITVGVVQHDIQSSQNHHIHKCTFFKSMTITISRIKLTTILDKYHIVQVKNLLHKRQYSVQPDSCGYSPPPASQRHPGFLVICNFPWQNKLKKVFKHLGSCNMKTSPFQVSKMFLTLPNSTECSKHINYYYHLNVKKKLLK